MEKAMLMDFDESKCEKSKKKRGGNITLIRLKHFLISSSHCCVKRKKYKTIKSLDNVALLITQNIRHASNVALV
jgi:hypothetical protein